MTNLVALLVAAAEALEILKPVFPERRTVRKLHPFCFRVRKVARVSEQPNRQALALKGTTFRGRTVLSSPFPPR